MVEDTPRPSSPGAEGGASDMTLTFQSLPDLADQGDGQGANPDLVEGLPAGSALLFVERGPNSGARFLLDAERTTVGRHPDSNIFLDDVTVSRKHAEFLRDPQGYVVRDIGSLNGTYVNRERVDARILRPGDEVQIGKYRLTYHPGRH